MAELQATTGRYASETGFTHYGFASKRYDPARSDSSYHFFQTFPDPYGRHRYETVYTSPQVLQDPLMRHLRHGLPATAFNDRGVVTHTRPDVIGNVKRLLQMAGENGLRSGIWAPLASTPMGWSFMVMSTDQSNKIHDVLFSLPDFHFFAHHVYCLTHRLLDPPEPEVQLTLRQCEILRWICAGKTSWEIGCILRVSTHTIDFHLRSIARKLGVNGRKAACAKALSLGLIAI